MFKKMSLSADRAYVAPLCEALDVQIEAVMCQSYGKPGEAGGNPGIGEEGNNYGGF